MASRKKSSVPAAVDPDAAGVVITLTGVRYRMLFDYAALREAELRLKAAGHAVNMLTLLDFVHEGADALPYLFFASLLRYQPKIVFAEAEALITMRTAHVVHQAVIDAYLQAMAEPQKKDAAADPTSEPPAA